MNMNDHRREKMNMNDKERQEEMRLNIAKDMFWKYYEKTSRLPMTEEERSKLAISQAIFTATELMKANREIPYE